MKAARSILPALLAVGLASACTQTSDGGGEDETSSAPVVAESPAPPEYAAPVLPVFEAVPGFTEAPDLEFPYKFAYENVGTALQMDGATGSNTIYITSYLLPEDVSVADYEERAALVPQYDEISSNEVEDANTSRTLTHGYAGVFRYAIVRDDAGKQIYQRNTFIFDGQLMIHLSCQWQDQADLVKSSCGQLESTLTIPSE
jgi:hypothetical protein